MMKDICNKERLLCHAKEISKKKGSVGFDRMHPKDAVSWLEINGDLLVRRLVRGSYEPLPALGFYVAKQGGGHRRLVKLTAIDTVIQHTILEATAPLCESFYSDFSFAYRPGRGVSAAVRQFCKYGRHYPFAAAIDATTCFDRIDHTVLEAVLKDAFPDAPTVDLIMKYVRLPVSVEGEIFHPTVGIAQGAPISNMLCNLYLTPLDRYLEQKKVPFVRYADDIMLFGASQQEIVDFYESTLEYMRRQLRLEGNGEKCCITSPADAVYLGHRFKNSRYGLTALDQESPVDDGFASWHSGLPANRHRRVDILSDGILRQKGFSLLFDTDEEDAVIPVRATDTINIHSSVILDSHSVKKALKNNITINIFDHNGRLIGRFVPHSPLKAPAVLHRQLLEYYNDEARMALAKQFVLSSIHNCRLNIRYYNDRTPCEQLKDALAAIRVLETKIKQCSDYNDLLMLEAGVRERYYGCYDTFIAKKEFVFGTRSRRPPRNEVNAMLSFGNTVLYSLIGTQINKTALDIRVGFLHATNRRAESLSLDVAESYKPLLVDRVVFSLINLGSIRPSHFRKEGSGGVYLNESGKQLFLRAFYSKLETTLKIKGRTLSYEQIIIEDIYNLVRHFRHGEKYIPFKQVK